MSRQASVTGDRLLYAAYGSNLSFARLRSRVSGFSRPYGQGILAGWRLQWIRGVLNITPSVDDVVPVGFWLLDMQSAADLDRYEGVPTFYTRRTLMAMRNVLEQEFQTVPCMVYVMTGETDDRASTEIRPSPNYLEQVRAGYGNFGLERWIDRFDTTLVPFD